MFHLDGPISSGIICSSSWAIVDESNAPASKASSKASLNFLGSFVFPIKSLNNISKLSATEAPFPRWPLANANKEAVVMFLIWVMIDKTVLLIWVAAFIPSKDFIIGNFNNWSIITVVELIASAISGSANIFSFCLPVPVTNMSSKSML